MRNDLIVVKMIELIDCVNLKLIWQIISEDLPELKEALEKI